MLLLQIHHKAKPAMVKTSSCLTGTRHTTDFIWLELHEYVSMKAAEVTTSVNIRKYIELKNAGSLKGTNVTNDTECIATPVLQNSERFLYFIMYVFQQSFVGSFWFVIVVSFLFKKRSVKFFSYFVNITTTRKWHDRLKNIHKKSSWNCFLYIFLSQKYSGFNIHSFFLIIKFLYIY